MLSHTRALGKHRLAICPNGARHSGVLLLFPIDSAMRKRSDWCTSRSVASPMLSTSSASNSFHDPDEEDDGRHRSAPQIHISVHVGTARRASIHASFIESAVPCTQSACTRASQTRVSVGVVDVYRLAMLTIRDGGAGGEGASSASIMSRWACSARRTPDWVF